MLRVLDVIKAAAQDTAVRIAPEAASSAQLIKFDASLMDPDVGLFSITAGVFDQEPTDSRENVVFSYGYNVAPGARFDPAEASIRMNIETHYDDTENDNLEWYVQAISTDGAVVARPFSSKFNKTGANLATSIAGDAISLYDLAAAQRVKFDLAADSINLNGGMTISQSTNNLNWLTQAKASSGATSLIKLDANDEVQLGEGGVVNSGLLVRNDTYANIYVSGGSTAQTSITSAVLMTGFATDGPSNDCTVAAASDKVTVSRAGDYEVLFSNSFTTSANNAVVTFTVYVNGSPSTLICQRKIGAGSDVGTTMCQGILAVGAAQDVEVYVASDASTSMTPIEAQLTVRRVGV